MPQDPFGGNIPAFLEQRFPMAPENYIDQNDVLILGANGDTHATEALLRSLDSRGIGGPIVITIEQPDFEGMHPPECLRDIALFDDPEPWGSRVDYAHVPKSDRQSHRRRKAMNGRKTRVNQQRMKKS